MRRPDPIIDIPEINIPIFLRIRNPNEISPRPETLDGQPRNGRNDPLALKLDFLNFLILLETHVPNVNVLAIHRGDEAAFVDPVDPQDPVLMLVVVADELSVVALLQLSLGLPVEALQRVTEQHDLCPLVVQHQPLLEGVDLHGRNIVFFPHELRLEFAGCAFNDI